MKVSIAALLLPVGLAAGFVAPGPAKTGTALHIFGPFKNEAYPKEEAFKKKNHHFKSRNLVDYQKDLEAGKVRHQFPVMFAKERIAKGELRPSDVPYEQRDGGRYDNTDVNVGYVPSGMAPHEWHDLQRAERRKQQSKNFAAVGPTSFKSRSLQGFQEALEKGQAGHLFPAMFAKQRVQKGEMKAEEVPYMQRGGSWDNSDVKGAKKQQWNEVDKKMESGVPDWLRRGFGGLGLAP